MPASPSWLTFDAQRECVTFRLPDGTPVHTHFSFGLVALLATFPLVFQGRLATLVLAALLIVILHLSILAHELGHKAAARRQGAHTTEIEIGFYGGTAHLEWDERRGIAMRPIALAGPVVNLQLAGAFYALYWLATYFGAPESTRYFVPFGAAGLLTRMLFLAFLLNLWLGLFNLLPAFPLDGGTIAEETLGARLGLRRTRLIIGFCGIVVAAVSVVFMFAMVLGGIPLIVLAPISANLEAIRENWSSQGNRTPPPSQAAAERVTSVIQFKKRGGSS